MSFNIEVEAGNSVRLPTAGKYCDRDIVVKASGNANGAYYDKFWDTYQDYGRKTIYNQYTGGFLGSSWNDDNFNPKYPIVLTDASYIFRQTGITDLTRDGIVMDFSQCKTFNYAFAYINHTTMKIPFIDLSIATNTTSTFQNLKGDTLHLKFSESTNIASNMLSGIQNLVNFTVEGTIGMNISLPNADKLSTESVQSIIDHLKDLTGQTAQKVQFHTTVAGKLTDEQIATIFAKNWTL